MLSCNCYFQNIKKRRNNRERRFGGRAPWRPLFLKNSNSNFYGSKNCEKMRVCKDVTHMCAKIHDEIP